MSMQFLAKSKPVLMIFSPGILRASFMTIDRSSIVSRKEPIMPIAFGPQVEKYILPVPFFLLVYARRLIVTKL
jgi:hypothetical protein